MIHEHFEHLLAKVQAAPSIPPETRDELLKQIAGLKAEVSALSETHADDAHSLARFAAASGHEATRSQQRPELLKAALHGLAISAEGLETTRPGLAQAVNRLAVTLSNIGI